jgi:gamma-glutamyltranspeptidase/glutathione hydrolase
MLERGGNAVDAAVAAGAVMAVTSPHMCGLGGDLFALVAGAGGPPLALNASGRAGSNADAAALRAEGLERMPFAGDVRAVTVPGCVDGLVALAQRCGRRSLADLLDPAIRLAESGFPASVTLAAAAATLTPAVREAGLGRAGAIAPGARLTVPGVARTLRAIAQQGRSGFYEGPAGEELCALPVGGSGAPLFAGEDLRARSANWVAPLTLRAFGRALWTIPPNSQGYLALSSAWIAHAVGVPTAPDDAQWPFVLVEASRQAAHDRPAVLHEHADGMALLAPQRLAPRAEAIGDRARRGLADDYSDGDTTCLCAVDAERVGVSLIMSNGANFGSRIVLGRSGIFLHNRGIGFSLQAGHPAEYGPGRRPPHTLAPVAVTGADDALCAVLGTMGGDAQPQIVLQLLARTLVAGQDAGTALAASRFCLTREPTTGFDTWDQDAPPLVALEHGAPAAWAPSLRERGYAVREGSPGDPGFGHAQMISVTEAAMLCGAADPRSDDGAFVGR